MAYGKSGYHVAFRFALRSRLRRLLCHEWQCSATLPLGNRQKTRALLIEARRLPFRRDRGLLNNANRHFEIGMTEILPTI